MIDEYIKARKAGQHEYKIRVKQGQYPFLTALDDIAAGNETLANMNLGILEIPVDLIEGTRTRARQNSFAANFMPLLEPDTEFAMKWSNLYNAQLSEGFNSPIKAYEYLHRFYVLEGNKRVSVSRFLDMPSISAEVIRLYPSRQVMEEHPEYAEFLEFYKVAPLYDIVCTEPGAYGEIAALAGQDLVEAWPEKKVKALRTAFWKFTETMKGLGDRMPELEMGDAFLVFMRIYGGDILEITDPKEIRNKILRIRNELLTAGNSEKVALVESSEEALKGGNLIENTGGKIGKLITQGIYSTKHPLKAAFIYDKAPECSNWVWNHDTGRQKVENAYGGIVATRAFVTGACPQGVNAQGPFYGSFEDAAHAAANWGADVVFTTSVKQMTDALRAAIMYKDIIFLNCSINLANQAVRTYYAKLYEAKFLAGMVAAINADNHKIGYCSDYPIYGTIASINAFAIGAAMIDPEAKIYLEWSTKQDADWLRTMRDNGINVISAVDSTHPVDGSEMYGVFKICEDGSIRHLAAPIWKWGKLYGIILKTILDGKYFTRLVDKRDKATNYWWGMISGVVDIKLSDDLPQYTRKLIEIMRNDIISGNAEPFGGELRSQNGLIRAVGDEPLSSMEVISMDWLNENIIGEIPDYDAFTDYAKETVSVSGVK
ncbi:MAG: BMP family ABC transporter substrate-binding protein [Clostridiales bacterium]|nr:BMP family ABC transporter substrate-binding protein [Clostridiales bacterium]